MRAGVAFILEDQFPFKWTITIVDNASTDGVLRVAKELAEADDRVRVLHLDRKGRGLALRTAWAYSDADVVVYMDVDLSTSLDALLPLVVLSVNGHSEARVLPFAESETFWGRQGSPGRTMFAVASSWWPSASSGLRSVVPRVDLTPQLSPGPQPCLPHFVPLSSAGAARSAG